MTQMKGGLNSHGFVWLLLPRDFGHFASLSCLRMKKRKNKKRKVWKENQGKKRQNNGASWNHFYV